MLSLKGLITGLAAIAGLYCGLGGQMTLTFLSDFKKKYPTNPVAAGETDREQRRVHGRHPHPWMWF